MLCDLEVSWMTPQAVGEKIPAIQLYHKRSYRKRPNKRPECLLTLGVQAGAFNIYIEGV